EYQSFMIGLVLLMKERGIDVFESTCQFLNLHQHQWQSVVFVSVNNKLIGAVAVSYRVKNDAKQMMVNLQKRGIRVVMATGDHLRVAETVGEQLGISDVQAQLLPEDKRNLVRQLQQQGRRVAFVGDGINDAPSLMQ